MLGRDLPERSLIFLLFHTFSFEVARFNYDLLDFIEFSRFLIVFGCFLNEIDNLSI